MVAPGEHVTAYQAVHFHMYADTIASQNMEIEELRQLVTRLTLASAVLVSQTTTENKPTPVPHNVVPFPQSPQ